MSNNCNVWNMSKPDIKIIKGKRVIMVRSGNLKEHPKLSYMSDNSIDIANYDSLLQFLLIGDNRVGKSTFMHLICDGIFQEKYHTTIGKSNNLKQI